MSHSRLPIESIPAWLALNDVSFYDLRITSVADRGYGLVTERRLTTAGETFDTPSLVSIPHELILSAETVAQYAKEDRNFRLLLDAVGEQAREDGVQKWHSTRIKVMLFLLVQLVHGSGSGPGRELAGVSTPWTEYVKFLPRPLHLPTLWSEAERDHLRGTSLSVCNSLWLFATLYPPTYSTYILVSGMHTQEFPTDLESYSSSRLRLSRNSWP